MNPKRGLFIGIGGGTASGKTTLVRELTDRYRDRGVSALCFDGYYRDLSHLTFAERDAINFDAPEAFDYPLFIEHLAALRRGQSIDAPIYDYSQHRRTEQTERISPAAIVIFDGILLLHEESIRREMDLIAFLDVEPEIRFARRLHRDVRERGRTPESVKSWWDERVQPSHLEFCEPTRKYAEIVVGQQWYPLIELIDQRLSSSPWAL